MNDENLDKSMPASGGSEPELILDPVADGVPPTAYLPPPRPLRRRWRLPLSLFLLTCLTTFLVGSHLRVLTLVPRRDVDSRGREGRLFAVYLHVQDGCLYALAVMTILMCHEMGHFLQARRYGVPASLPFFIPVPIGPIGTFGAVIGMSSNITNRRALFDIGVTGPLAGLVPTLICCVVGVQLSERGPVEAFSTQYGDPLLLKLLYRWQFGPLPEGWDVAINPILWAGWVGLLVTALNLMPIGQLDGGHILYSLLRKKAHVVATLLLLAAGVVVAISVVLALLGISNSGLWVWWLILVLLILMGPKHPPTAKDDVPLGLWRHVLGWLALAFIVIGFTPKPFIKL
jgi:membrane-associated protease RseP (regulator of RpoE activity)